MKCNPKRAETIKQFLMFLSHVLIFCRGNTQICTFAAQGGLLILQNYFSVEGVYVCAEVGVLQCEVRQSVGESGMFTPCEN